MTGHWESAEPPVHAPNQQRQQQQQRPVVREQRQPLHFATTPAWGTGDRVVKAEPTEDKNNDSGVSPGHYTSNSSTSPSSGASTSTANCSLSPGSVNSQDSNNMQARSFEYSPRRAYKNCEVPANDYRDRATDNERAQATGPKSPNEEANQDSLQCPICGFVTKNRLNFTEHLATHCTSKSETQEFVKSVLDQLMPGPSKTAQEDNRSSSTQGERSEHEMEEAEEPGVRVPRLNSQGKVKTYKCKQCDFVAITKLQFWEHSRIHIKAEKLLTCLKCPFVTEYKHHLEYHLRNHYGSKPYKCDKCSYSCVNKSMLNSHLKSHSNVYQYSCANCTYATKYCHSLKLHLRKYQHQPAMVLNADGSPNPLPIIDVYGTRRGPKARPTRPAKPTRPAREEDPCHNDGAGIESVQGGIPSTPAGQHVAIPQNTALAHNLQAHPMIDASNVIAVDGANALNNMGGMGGLSAGGSGILNAANNNNAGNNGPATVRQPQAVISYPYHQMYTGLPMIHHPSTEANGAQQPLDQGRSSILMGYLRAADGERMPEEAPQDLAVRSYNGHSAPSGSSNRVPCNEIPKVYGTEMGAVPMYQDVYMEDSAAPLDLSKPGASTLQKPATAAVNSPRATGTSRRKGRAVKLDRRVVEEDTDDEQQSRQVLQQESSQPPATGEREGGEGNGRNVLTTEYFCQYCEIAFGNVVMYTVHMGYHGYNDPYTCNMCGHQSNDKVSFFLHIARSKHS